MLLRLHWIAAAGICLAAVLDLRRPADAGLAVAAGAFVLVGWLASIFGGSGGRS